MRKKIYMFFIIVAMIFFNGCDKFSLPEEMIQKPNMDNKIAVAEKVIRDLPINYELIIPKNIEEGSAINFADLTGDGKEELIAVYKNKDKLNEYGIIILKELLGTWDQLYIIDGVAVEIDAIMLKDINNDGKHEIILKWLEEDEKIRVEVYGEKNNKMFLRFEKKCDDVEIIDLDNDNIDDIVLLNITEDGQIKASLYNIADSEGQLTNDIIIPSDGSVRSFTANSGKATEVINGIFVDVQIGIYSGYTELLIKKDGMLKKVFSKDVEDFGITQSMTITNDADIDKDGIREINILYKEEPLEIEIDENLMISSNNENPTIQKWYNWDGASGIIPKVDVFYDQTNGFRFYLPKEWNNNYVMEVNESKKIKYMFIYQRDEYPIRKVELARLIVIDDSYLDDFNRNASEAGRVFVDIGQNNGKTFKFYNNKNDSRVKKELKVDDEKIKVNFEIFR
ncbi:hypothetical protein [Oceanirhabdus sp. W0125-5]|uniref:hypothetical protein n=1 Tax=Oceanirhabdus sp. W0125-5 TaxID=2999116 RepID=UPI0022F3200B|nr:hypothetical protein [Oceanirhabdus sp. W0125-5]WBW99331.1 hypothetical protein OW730_11470 [Oceanirhabdus sp. W0125-5]